MLHKEALRMVGVTSFLAVHVLDKSSPKKTLHAFISREMALYDAVISLAEHSDDIKTTPYHSIQHLPPTPLTHNEVNTLKNQYIKL